MAKTITPHHAVRWGLAILLLICEYSMKIVSLSSHPEITDSRSTSFAIGIVGQDCAVKCGRALWASLTGIEEEPSGIDTAVATVSGPTLEVGFVYIGSLLLLSFGNGAFGIY